MFISRYLLRIQVHQMPFLRARTLKNNRKLNLILAVMVSGGAAMVLHLDGKIDALSSNFAAQAEADRALAAADRSITATQAAADRSLAMANSQSCINQFNALLRLHGLPPIPVPPVITSQISSSSTPAKETTPDGAPSE
jgi:hypothetical protein